MGEREQIRLAGGFGFLEAPRWHDERLWVSDMARHTVFTVDASGTATPMFELDDSPSGLGWLPDGRLLVVSMHARKVLRREHYGRLVLHADLGPLVDADLNDMVVDGHGRAYVTNFGYDAATSEPKSTGVVLVHPDGSTEGPVGELFRPNGCGIVQDGSTFVVAETRVHRLAAFRIADDGSLHDQRTIGELPSGSWADGLCLDAEDAVWVADPKGRRCFRLTKDGETTDIIDTSPMPTVSCALGGPDRRTLFLTLAPIRPFDEAAGGGVAEIRTVAVEVPGAGWP